MRPLIIRSWPRAIAHIDGDAFFASVEQAIHPELKGRPVVTGAERGIVSAASYEAKALGIKRGVPLYEVRRICPDCVFVPSDYETYSIFSQRMFSIVRRFTPAVEEYSIDECFCDLTGLRRLHRTSYEEIAERMQESIHEELDITVSVGISLSKSLAKLCSKFRKPIGLTSVSGKHIHLLLERTPLRSVWGFGPSSVVLLEKYGLKSALDFVLCPQSFASGVMGKVGRDLWSELRGEYINKISERETRPISISKTKTFTPPSRDAEYVWARALRNLEAACIKARRYGLVARRLFLNLRTQEFQGSGFDLKIERPTSSTNELTRPMRELFDRSFCKGTLYRATGVVLGDLVESCPTQFGLFEDAATVLNNERVFGAVDDLAKRFGKHTVFLADCARLGGQHVGDRGKPAERKKNALKGETERKRIGMPMWQIKK